MLLDTLLLLPLLGALISFFGRRAWWCEAATLVASSLTLVLSGLVAHAVTSYGHLSGAGGWLYVDALSALTILVVGFVGATAALYSIGYIRADIRPEPGDSEEQTRTRFRRYYVLFNLFLFSMLVVPASNSLGILWIAIEATTLVSLFLVSFYGTREALEAAWKYVIVGSVGIALALFGTILVYYSAVRILGTGYDLTWSVLLPAAPQLDPKAMQLAFLFIVVGFGTKAGLAPMHTWLPDAHGEAPSPISAMLSGVLLNCAMYAILRYYALATPSLGMVYPSTLLLAFGLFSLLIATLFVLQQQDYKRLLAYSSVEHMGIIASGIAFGGSLGLYGALLQLLNHAITKSLMFFASGHLLLRFETKRIEKVSGVIRLMPVSGSFLMVGALALTGAPPFGIFASELTILSAGFRAGKAAAALVVLLALVVIFIGFMGAINRMAFGPPPAEQSRGYVNPLGLVAMACCLVIVVGLGLVMPVPLRDLLQQAAHVLGG
ncbi:MAG: hydrogenase 4 subunit F [Chloroflexi bacterium]|nr:hydrogenase 4 subunit F [Chloroflexota bacterium]